VDHPAVKLTRLQAARSAVRALQRLAAGPAEALAGLGLAFLVLVAPRRGLLLAIVPAYVLLVQAPMHFEPRFALPRDAFTPALEGVGLVALLAVAGRAARRGVTSAR
jgi:hypothetical protein